MRTLEPCRKALRIAALLAAALLVGCGSPSDYDPARSTMSVNIDIPAPYLPYATSMTALVPVRLAVMVCADITASTARPCDRNNERHLVGNFSLTDGMEDASRTLNVRYGENQVVFVQGLNAESPARVTYHGYATMPTIKPRAHYSLHIAMEQILFLQALPPAAPVVLEPEQNPYPAGPNELLVFKGEREEGTHLEVSTTSPSFRIALGGESPAVFTSSGGMYQQIIRDDGVIEWTLTFQPYTETGTHTLTFRAVRESTLGEATTRSVCYTNCPND